MIAPANDRAPARHRRSRLSVGCSASNAHGDTTCVGVALPLEEQSFS
jgi:hypothetical protein